MNKVASYLNQHIVGNVFDKDSILDAYSTDRSILKIKPRFVAFPETTQDVCKILNFVNQLAIKNYKLPIAVRGSGLDKTGADLTSGMVISTEKMNHVKEIDPRSRLVRVEAGITLEQLNSALSLHGLTLPLGTDPKQTIGGIISNCQIDSYASKYGGIINHIERIEAVLSNGDRLQTLKLNPKKLEQKKIGRSFEAKLHKEIDQLVSSQSRTINELMNTSCDSSGYPAVTCVKGEKYFDFTPIFLAAQGTLGVITEVILHCDVIPAPSRHIFIAFNSIQKALDFLNFALSLNPAEANLYDMRIFEKSEEYGKKFNFLTKKNDDTFLAVINLNDSKRKNEKNLELLMPRIPRRSNYLIETEENKIYTKELLGALTNYLNSDARGEKVGLLDDFYIPAQELADFIEKLADLEKEFKLTLPLSGSFSTENYSIRPDLKLEIKDDDPEKIEEQKQNLIKLMIAFNILVSEHKGSFTGGAPEGRTKASITTPLMNVERKELYQKIKELFDPNGILNPDIKLGIDPKTILKHLRTSYGDYIVV